MNQPTPGPWEVAHGGSYRNGAYQLDEYFVRRPEDDVSIAADIIDPDTSKPSKANANLIAAAPDLLAALDTLLSVYLDEYEILTVRADDTTAVQMARAALARARGLDTD